MRRESGIRNMTEGSALRHIVWFTLPLLAGNFLQQFYNMVDSWVVGNYVSDAALAAVGVGFPVIFLFTSLFSGIATGGTVVIAQAFGAWKPERVRHAIDSLYTAFVRSILPITIIALLLVSPLMTVLRVDPAAWAETRTYLLVVCAGLIGNIGYNLNAGILNGVGNSSTTLLFLMVSTVLNILLDLLLVLAFSMGVLGVALGTVIAQACSWLFGIWYINRNYPQLAIHPFSGFFDRKLFAEIIRIGLPSGIQMSLVALGAMFVLSKVNSFGKAFTAGFNVGNKLDTLAFLPTQSMAAAVISFVGQNMGAGREDRHAGGCLDGSQLRAGGVAVRSPVPDLLPRPGGYCRQRRVSAVRHAALCAVFHPVCAEFRHAGCRRQRLPHGQCGRLRYSAAGSLPVPAGRQIRPGLYVLELWYRLGRGLCAVGLPLCLRQVAGQIPRRLTPAAVSGRTAREDPPEQGLDKSLCFFYNQFDRRQLNTGALKRTSAEMQD